MTRVLRWVGIGIGSILVLAVLAALALPALVNLERYRGVLASRVGKALGREVTLGALRMSLWGGLGAEAKGIQVAQATGFDSEPFVAADALRVRVQLLPLLRGQVRVSSAILERPRIRLTHALDGRWSIEDLLRGPATPHGPKPTTEAGRPGKAPLLGGLLLSEVAVRNGEITVLDQAHRKGFSFSLIDLDLNLRQASVSDPIEVRSRAKIGGTGTGRIESTAQLSAGDGDTPILDATVTLRDVEVGPWQDVFLSGGRTKLSGPLSAEIKVTGPVSRAAFSGSVSLKPVAIQVGDVFRKLAGEEANLRYEGRREGQGVHLPKLTLTLKDMAVEGSLRIPDLAVPRIMFTATSGKLDLGRLLGRPAEKGAWLGPAATFAASPPAPSGSTITGSGFVALGRVSIGDLRYKALTWTGVEADLGYQDGVVHLSSVRANFLDGKLTAKGEVDLRPRVPRVTLTSRLDSVMTEPLVKALALGSWTLRGALGFDSSLSFVGFSTQDILGSAAGGGSFLLKDGRLSDYRPLERLTEVIGPILASQGIRARLNEFEQVSAHYTLDKGVLRTRDLTLTKTEGTLTAVGSLGLLDSSLNFDVVAKLGRATVEAKVTGTTNQPIVVPKLGRLQRRIESELDKAAPDERGKGLKGLLKGLFGR